MISGTFKYLGSDDVTKREYSYSFDDKWFNIPSTDVNLDLLKFALNLSLSASIKEDILNFYNQLGFSYTDNIDYEKEGLNVLAGDIVKDTIYYPAPEINGKYYYNSIAYAIGFKKVEDYTILLVSIRGGDYKSEWGGNFNIGTGINAKGFDLAAQQVIAGIKTTVAECNITGKVKVLTAGYSRAAATANLVGAHLNNGAVEGLNKEDIYTFSFECPRTTRDPEALSDKYSNLISVSNPNDIVPKLAEAIFGFKRYGRTLFLPSALSCANYQEREEKMEIAEKEVVPFKYDPANDVYYLEDTFINDLAFAFDGVEGYTEHFQAALMNATAVFLGGAHEEVTLEQMEVVGELERKLFELNPENTILIGKLFGGTPKMIFRVSFSSPILQNHAMELTLSWISSFNSLSDFGEDNFRVIYINGAENIDIYNSDNSLNSKIENNKVTKQSDNAWIDVQESGQKVIILTPGYEYKIQIDDSDYSVSLNNFNMNIGKSIEAYNFSQLNESTQFIIPKEGIKKYSAKSLAQNKDIISSKKIINSNGIDYYKIYIESNNESEVFGGGYFSEGQYAFAKVKTDEGFLGWYVDDKKISDSKEYVFPVIDSVHLIAKYK